MIQDAVSKIAQKIVTYYLNGPWISSSKYKREITITSVPVSVKPPNRVVVNEELVTFEASVVVFATIVAPSEEISIAGRVVEKSDCSTVVLVKLVCVEKTSQFQRVHANLGFSSIRGQPGGNDGLLQP
jgi:hypothetical protein